MARQPSKIMSIVEKKAATAGLKTALKQHNDSVKLIGVEQKEADKVFAAAKKTADTMMSEATKVLAAVSREADKLVAAATKAHVAATGKTAKSTAAAAKGTEKLTGQLAVLEAAPAAPAVKTAVKKTAPVAELETA